MCVCHHLLQWELTFRDFKQFLTCPYFRLSSVDTFHQPNSIITVQDTIAKPHRYVCMNVVETEKEAEFKAGMV